jgi:hypothetical protein
MLMIGDGIQADENVNRDPFIAGLNRSRLAGKWIAHDDGSYDWSTHAIIIRLPVSGGTLVNKTDARWEFQGN